MRGVGGEEGGGGGGGERGRTEEERGKVCGGLEQAEHTAPARARDKVPRCQSLRVVIDALVCDFE